MTLFKTIVRRLRGNPTPARQLEPAAAYDLWAATYDNQPTNLILHVDEVVFSRLLGRVDLHNKTIVDIGCGIGRHWNRILQQKPAALTGYDVSTEMLKQLRRNFPDARTNLLHNGSLSEA